VNLLCEYLLWVHWVFDSQQGASAEVLNVLIAVVTVLTVSFNCP
jgi:hypothetical protein